MLILFIPLISLIWNIKGITCIRNVHLMMPSLVRAGGTVTMLCLFDLEEAPLYSVKWYRGQHEFFRFVPGDDPPAKVFQIAGIYVDVFSSNQHQVTLNNLPTYVSGEISCEVTTDSPSFSTVCVSEMLNIRNLNIDLSVVQLEYEPGEQLEAICTTSTPAELSFYINSRRVSQDYVKQETPSSAFLNLTITDNHFRPRGNFRLQCSGGISNQYYISTRNVEIRKRVDFINSSESQQFRLLFFVLFFSVNVLLQSIK